MITSGDIRNVQTSWAMVSAISDTFGELLYRRLSDRHAVFRRLITEGAVPDSGTTIRALAVFVHHLADGDEIIPVVCSAASASESQCQPLSEHEREFADGLLWTLKLSLGLQFRPDMKRSWIRAARLFAETWCFDLPSSRNSRPLTDSDDTPRTQVRVTNHGLAEQSSGHSMACLTGSE
ncbi:MAG: hypothetical protein R3C49_24560 [Planctomycetaceae bacterium]